jgi:hypothetical protein
MDQDALVRLTLPGYNNSLYLSDKLLDIIGPAVGGELASNAPGSCVVDAWTAVAIAASSSGIVFAGAGDGEAGAALELVPLFILVGIVGADNVGKP